MTVVNLALARAGADAVSAAELIESRRRANGRILTSVRNVAGVQAAALTNGLPTSGFRTRIVGDDDHREVLPRWVSSAWVSNGFFSALHIPLLRGREFNDTIDRIGSRRVAIVSTDLSAALWGKADPIGRRVAVAPRPGETPQWMEVIGLVGAVSALGGERMSPTLYVALSQQAHPLATTLIIRADLSSAKLEQLLGGVEVNDKSGLAVTSVHALPAMVDAMLFATRAMALFLTIAAWFAVAVTAMGLYGSVSHALQIRAREIAIRRALGRSDHALIRFLLRDTVKVATLGVGIGCLITPFAVRLSETYLGRIDGPYVRETLAAGGLVFILAAISAYLPAARTMRRSVSDLLRAGES